MLNNPEDSRYDVDPDYVENYIKNVFSADAAENIVNVLDSFYVGDEHFKNSSRFSQLKKKIRLLLYFDIKKRWGKRIVGKLFNQTPFSSINYHRFERKLFESKKPGKNRF